ncbi:MAG: hypothetical protein HBSAPP04_22540 [Ignavibacteriaceae bacterium]|nr:MAG: hypothetical protein HBSAPP04_22540 [Ignavibacteriaceae bacterium]
MIQEKIYEIAGVKCRINFDQTLREVKEIDDMVARCGGYDLTLEDTERFLSIVLKAESPVDMLDIKESQLTDVMAEYFGKKKIWTTNMVESLISSALAENGLNPKSSDSEKPESVT